MEQVFADRITRYGYTFEPASGAAPQGSARVSHPNDPLARERAPGYLLARATGAVLGRRHVTPDFIAGAARAGTTGVLNQMRTHPGILFCAREELHYFDIEGRWSQGPGYYRGKFPLRSAQAAAIRDGRGPALQW